MHPPKKLTLAPLSSLPSPSPPPLCLPPSPPPSLSVPLPGSDDLRPRVPRGGRLLRRGRRRPSARSSAGAARSPLRSCPTASTASRAAAGAARTTPRGRSTPRPRRSRRTRGWRRSRASEAAKGSERVVQMDVFYSSWRSRTVPCPSGDPGAPPACETLLLHREDFKIPENLARFAVKAGMAGFVKKMAPAVRAFVAERRARGVPPGAHDARAYGVSGPGPPSQPRGRATGSLRGARCRPPPRPRRFSRSAKDHGAASPPPPLPLPLSASAAPARRLGGKGLGPAPPRLRLLRAAPSLLLDRPQGLAGGRHGHGGLGQHQARPPASFALSAMASEESEEQRARGLDERRKLLCRRRACAGPRRRRRSSRRSAACSPRRRRTSRTCSPREWAGPWAPR